uniref:Protein kinase domain-containing protein n=1 Tax=Romanomermis culicivorax TaxID=13658 RepID=A0A915HJL6_ROMCU
MCSLTNNHFPDNRILENILAPLTIRELIMDSMEHESSPPIYSKPKQRFEISRKLGSGTYGKVSLAMDHKMQEQVAVKIIKKSAIENAQDLLRIRREIRIMSALKHPNIVEIKEVFENHEKIIIVMEYADGGELYDYVSQHGPLPEEEVCKIFRQIVSAIYYCHKHGVCHRDLKLENILLDKNGVAKIADFGLSNYFMDHGLLNTFCGSPLYASPEIINGVPYRGPEVDCWSLGVLLYTLAYSSMPFDGRDFNRMVRQIKKGTYYEPDPPSSASMLIRAMLRVNPERRADIDMIASHWWVNFDENLLPIQDLPENQIIDSTPLNLRNETIIIQNFAEDSDMFSEYSCLSTRTRRKIDEFRRRRHETSDTFSNNGSYDFGGASSSSTAAPAKRLTTTIERNQKSAVGVQLAASHDYANDPLSKLLEPEDSMNDSLQRLKDLELRLITSSNHQPRMHSEVLFNKRRQSKEALAAAAGGARLDQILHSSETENVPEIVKKIASAGAADLSSSATSSQENDRGGGHNQVKNAQSNIINDTHNEAIPVDVAEQSCTSANQEEGNRLVNQLLEEAERGVVGLALIEKIKNHDAYRTQKFVKEIVDSIVEVQQQQKAASARKQSVTKMSAMARQHSRDASLSRSTNKQSNQDAKDLITQNDLPDLVKNQNDQIAQERPPDLVADDKTSSISGKMPTKASIKQDSIHENLQEIEEEDVNSTDFEDLEIEDDEDEYMPPSFEPHATGQDVSPSDSFVTANDSAPKDSNTVSPATQKEESYPPGLSKRLSRGKYEKSKFIYGREVHVEPSPPPARIIRLGLAVQPVPEEAPELFNQAKQYILAYPDVAGDGPSSRKIAWLKTVDPDMGSSQEIEETPPRTPRHSMTGVVEQGGNGYKVLWPPPPTQSAAKNVDSVEGCDDHDTSIDAIVCIKMNGPRHKLSRTYDVGTTTIGLPAFGDVEKSENEIQEPQQVDAANKMNIDGVSFRRPRRPPRRSQLGNQNSLETPLELRQLDEKDKSSLVDVLLSPKNSIDLLQKMHEKF